MYHLKTRFGCVVAISNNLCTNKEDNDELQKLEKKKMMAKKYIYTRNDQKQESAKANKINKHSFFCASFDAIVRYQNQNFLAKPQRVCCIVNISQLLCQCVYMLLCTHNSRNMLFYIIIIVGHFSDKFPLFIFILVYFLIRLIEMNRKIQEIHTLTGDRILKIHLLLCSIHLVCSLNKSDLFSVTKKKIFPAISILCKDLF